MQNVFPGLCYRDARAAIDWLGRAFGYVEHMVVDGENGKVTHAELALGEGRMVMLSSDGGDRFGSHVGTGWSYVVVDDPDGLFERANAAGAEIVQELIDTDYGSRDFSVRDREGNLWSFGTYNPCKSKVARARSQPYPESARTLEVRREPERRSLVFDFPQVDDGVAGIPLFLSAVGFAETSVLRHIARP